MSQQTDSSGSQMSEGSSTRLLQNSTKQLSDEHLQLQADDIGFPIDDDFDYREDNTDTEVYNENNNIHHQYLIEEEITEEITEYISDKEETSTSSRSVTKSGPWLSSQPSLGNSIDCIL